MKRFLGKSMCVILLIISTVACSDKNKQTEIERLVKVQKPLKISMAENSIVLPASVSERRETKLSFRVGGPLTYLNDVVGCYVNKGDIIAKIDSRDFQIYLHSAESNYKLAEADYERYKELYKKESASKSVFDQMETRYKLAKANYESASNALQDIELRAPFSGYINQVFANNFEDVKPGNPIISLIDVSEFEVTAWLSVDDASQITEKNSFFCLVNSEGSKIKIPGRLKEIGNKTSLSKQSIPVTILIPNTEENTIKAGMVAQLEIKKDNQNASSLFELPMSSVFKRESNTWVWKLNETSNTVSARKVNIGRVLDNGSIEILDGISENDLIVTAGVNYLFEGQSARKLDEFSKTNIGNKL